MQPRIPLIGGISLIWKHMYPKDLFGNSHSSIIYKTKKKKKSVQMFMNW